MRRVSPIFGVVRKETMENQNHFKINLVILNIVITI